MSPENILAIDNGTQSVRALLFDPKGTLLAKSQVPFEPYYSVAPGWAEQDPMVFWNSLCEACQGLWSQPNVSKESIAAVTLTTQRATVVLVDKDGTPLRPAISWLDQRRTEGLRPIRGLWGLAFRLAGATETAAYLQAEAEANWIRTQEPEHWENHHKYLFLSGFLTHMLVGDFIDSVGSQVGYIPFDYKAQTWSKPSDWKWQAVPLPKEKLGKLVKPAAQLGEITAQASEATGIPVGLPMIAAAADKACEVIGSGCFEPHIGSLSFGTTATVNTTHKKYIEVIPLIPPYPAAVPGYYTLEISVSRGYWMVSWFKQEFGLLEQQLADKKGVQPEELFDDLVHAVPPGSQGLVLQPYWSPGLRMPGPEARGAVIGFSDFHTRAHVYRAILEGLAYALREGAERTTKRTGVPITELRVAGGGSQSDAAMQLTADIFGLPTYRPHTYEASGLGAAIDGAVGMGIHPDFATAVKEMTHLGDGFEPNPKAQKLYDRLYHEVYSKMYKSLRPLYQTIRDITHNHE
ncbi:MAG: FGGY-family carbohydrate kinase [Anaerolineaceae bacterium]|nr:FGGY-family carbohydrate kinase [Anaerolineaceae bacterium]